jgi:hypothetical protein
MKTIKTLTYAFVLGTILLATCSSSFAMTPGAVALAAADDRCQQCLNDYYNSVFFCVDHFQEPILGLCIEQAITSLDICDGGHCNFDTITLNRPAPAAHPVEAFALRPWSRQRFFDAGHPASLAWTSSTYLRKVFVDLASIEACGYWPAAKA